MKAYGYFESGYTGYSFFEGGKIFSPSKSGIGGRAKTSQKRTDRAMKRRSRQKTKLEIRSSYPH